MNKDEPTLFSLSSNDTPLPQRCRPKRTTDIVGQGHILNSRFFQLLRSDRWAGLIFWGPPGTGKTSLAWAMASETGRPFHTVSAVNSGVKEIRELLDKSYSDFKCGKKAHILFIDELHRLNKSQQDVLLPFLEQGSVRFIGATTENPSFEVNNAVSSRCLILKFNSLSTDDLLTITLRAVPKERSVAPEVIEKISRASNGDARRALNLLEAIIELAGDRREIMLTDFEELSHSQSLYYDKGADSHYDTISAFIKSIRGSDPHAGVYYLARMLEGGEDPIFIARRLVILSSEDIGNADPHALVLSTSAFQAVHAVGMPEARIILSQVVSYLACAPKSNRSYVAINQAQAVVQSTGNLSIPRHILNKAERDSYDYPHDHPAGWVEAQYLPETLAGTTLYQPTDRGAESGFLKSMKLRRQLPDVKPDAGRDV